MAASIAEKLAEVGIERVFAHFVMDAKGKWLVVGKSNRWASPIFGMRHEVRSKEHARRILSEQYADLPVQITPSLKSMVRGFG